MTSPPPSRSDRINLRRLLLWGAIAVIVVAGVVLYFRFGGQPVPLIRQVR